MVFHIKGTPNWTNLLRWLQPYYEHRCQSYVLSGGSRLELNAGANLFRLVKTLRDDGLTWAQVEKVLVPMREALGAENRQWLAND